MSGTESAGVHDGAPPSGPPVAGIPKRCGHSTPTPPARPMSCTAKGLCLGFDGRSVLIRRRHRTGPRHHHRADRADRVGQVHLPPHDQPDERQGARVHATKVTSRSTTSSIWSHRPGPAHAAPSGRDALPAPQPVPDVDPGQRRRRREGAPHRQGQAARRGRRAPADRGRPVGCGEGPARATRRSACPAASSSCSAWPARSPSGPRSCCSTSPRLRSTRSPPRWSRI